jgi:hypothetical protein
MAAVTINGRRRDSGNLRRVLFNVTIAASGDTLRVTGFSKIYAVLLLNSEIWSYTVTDKNLITFTGDTMPQTLQIEVIGC